MASLTKLSLSEWKEICKILNKAIRGGSCCYLGFDSLQLILSHNGIMNIHIFITTMLQLRDKWTNYTLFCWPHLELFNLKSSSSIYLSYITAVWSYHCTLIKYHRKIIFNIWNRTWPKYWSWKVLTVTWWLMSSQQTELIQWPSLFKWPLVCGCFQLIIQW